VVVQSELDAVVKKLDKQSPIAEQMRAQRDDALKKLVVTENEKNEARQLRAQTTNEKQAVEQDRDDLKRQRDSALARLKCCDCFRHGSSLHAFSPCSCGHKICAHAKTSIHLKCRVRLVRSKPRGVCICVIERPTYVFVFNLCVLIIVTGYAIIGLV
jgi:hypothetical protein